MPTELEELVEFLHHGNTQIRQVAIEHLVGYSTSQPLIFKAGQLTPIKDLKLLIRDYPVRSISPIKLASRDGGYGLTALQPLAKNALIMLINLSDDRDVLQNIATDDTFLESLLVRITNTKEPNANEIAMLLANMAKLDDLKRILTLTRDVPKSLSISKYAMDQLMDCFVKGAEGRYNEDANFDYLAYFFADIAKYPDGRKYFVTTQPYDSVIPLTKLTVFTEHKSTIRRRGVASTIKNVSFDIPSHPSFLSSSEINVLPYLLLPITGPEEFSEEDALSLLPDLQLLPPDKTRDSDESIITTHLETLLILTTTKEGRELMREVKVYPIVRETHLHVDDEGVQDACDRLVQVLMRDEEDEEKVIEDDDNKVVEIF
ncbi:MAG: hypothetical protein M1827_006006 [Pycnora praestabilis]|nr:MAG: hypothetical protein M1827_006006 [Pycnora praestabilis]